MGVWSEKFAGPIYQKRDYMEELKFETSGCLESRRLKVEKIDSLQKVFFLKKLTMSFSGANFFERF